MITDTKATEKNYLYGLRDSIPKILQDRLIIKVSNAPRHEMIKKASEMIATEPQYRKPWIVFDKDEFSSFDEMIVEAKNQGIETGWSNPCIEIWFHAYFGEMPINQTSTKCNEGFRKIYKDKTGQVYDKATVDNYIKLCKYGSEENAIRIAKSRYHQQCRTHTKPSAMLSTTTLHRLIDEIREKIKTEGHSYA